MGFDQSERAQGPIYILKVNKGVISQYATLYLITNYMNKLLILNEILDYEILNPKEKLFYLWICSHFIHYSFKIFATDSNVISCPV